MIGWHGATSQVRRQRYLGILRPTIAPRNAIYGNAVLNMAGCNVKSSVDCYNAAAIRTLAERARMQQISYEQVEQTARFVQERTAFRPKIGLVLGSGLSGLADRVETADVIRYDDLPNWPTSTVKGHAGRLVFGRLAGKEILIMQGRAHYYEGYSLAQVTFPIRVMALLGIETLILTNAAGGINPTFNAGDLMLIDDHINFMGMAGQSPLRGPNEPRFGTRFPDMTFAYDRDLLATARVAAASIDLTIQQGVYTWIGGPNFESSAEIRLLHALGTDAVGMSTVPAVIVARHAGLRVLGISTITNVAPHHPDPDHTTTHEEVIETGAIIVPRLEALLTAILQRI